MSNVLNVSQRVGVEVVRANRKQEPEPPASVNAVDKFAQAAFTITTLDQAILLQKEDVKCSSPS